MSRLIKKAFSRYRALSLTKKCVVISALLHVLLILFFIETPLLVRKKENSFFQTNTLLSSPVTLKDESEYQLDGQRKLRDFFSHFEPLSAQNQRPYDLLVNLHPFKYRPGLEKVEKNHIDLETPMEPLSTPDSFCAYDVSEQEEFPFREGIIQNALDHLVHHKATIEKTTPLAITAEFNLPVIEEPGQSEPQFHYDIASIARDTPIENQVESTLQQMAIIEQNDTCTIPTLPSEDTLVFDSKEPKLIEDSAQPTLIPDGVRYALKTVANTQLIASSKNPVQGLDHYTILDQIALVGWSEHYDAEVKYFPKTEGPGFFFSITLNPNMDMTPWKVKQNFYFLIDRSNSIERPRFATFKKGVMKALQVLDKEDHFNLCIFDKKMYLLSIEPIAATPNGLRAAEEFLEHHEYKSHFGVADVYDSLLKMIPVDMSEHVVNTSILLSDGGTSLAPKKLQQTIKSWLERNNHKTNLYAATVGEGNNLILLDLISSCSQGARIHSDTYAAFPRKLATFIKEIKQPLAKQVLGTAIPSSKGDKIVLHTILAKLPNLFCTGPYVITGETTSLENFTLVLQAKHENQLIMIEKEIVFDQDKMKSRHAEELCKVWKAHVQYEHFLKDGKEAHLLEAQNLLRKTKSFK